MFEELLATYERIYIYTSTFDKEIVELLKQKVDLSVCTVIEASEEFLSLYTTYEFSDKVCLLTEDSYFPTVINYYRTGLLSKDELLEALTV